MENIQWVKKITQSEWTSSLTYTEKIDKILLFLLKYNIKVNAIWWESVIKERTLTTVPWVWIVKIIGDVFLQRDIWNYKLDIQKKHTRLYLSSWLASLYTYICLYQMCQSGINIEDSLSFAVAKTYSSGAWMVSTLHQLSQIHKTISKIDQEKIWIFIDTKAQKELTYLKSQEFRQEVSVCIQHMFLNLV